MSAATKTKTAQPESAAAPQNLVQLSIPTPPGDAAQEAMTAVTYAQAFAITSASDSAKGQEARARLNTKIKTLTEARLSLTRPIDAAKQKIMDFFKDPIAKLTLARDMIDDKVLAWDNEQERIRQAEQRRLDEIARKERERLQMIADEAKRKADAEAAEIRRKADAAAAAGRAAEAAKLSAQAVRVEEKAADKVDQFEQRAATTVAPVAQAETARISGTSFREYPEHEILDPTLIKPEFMMPDEVKIGRVVRSLGLAAVDVVGKGGIKVTMKKGLASRRT